MMNAEQRSSAWSRWGPWAVLLCAWVLKTWEIWRHLSQRSYALWGLYFDTLQMYWMSWWTNFVLHNPERSIFFTTLINHPNGAATGNKYGLAWVHVAFAGVLRYFFGPNAAHNLVALMGCAITLVGLFLLLRHLSRNGWLAATLAALVFTFGIGLGGTLPDLEVILFGYTALAMLAWIRYLEDGGRWRLVLTVALVVWTCYTQMYYGLSLLSMLAVGTVVSMAGLSPVDAPTSRIGRRTLLVLGLGLALSLLAHLGNIIHVLQGFTSIPNTDLERAPPTGFPISVWWAVAAVVFYGTTMWLAIRARLASVVFWGLLVLPVTILSLGDFLVINSETTISMPFEWMRKVSPILNRVNWTFRFIPSVLMGMAAMYALLWRHRARVMDALPGSWTERRLAVALVFVFWVGAAFGPVVPRFERIPLLEGSPVSKACAAEFPDGCAMTQQWARLCGAQPGTERPSPVEPAPGPIWALVHLAEPFRPVATLPIPGPSPCIEYLMALDDQDALLEFNPSGDSGYPALFQTYHERPLAGFPMFAERYRGRVDSTPFTFLPQEFYHDQLTVEDLPDVETLAAGGVGWVSLYRGKLRPWCGWVMAVEGFTAPWMPDEDDFTELYGPPVCRDPVLSLFRTMP